MASVQSPASLWLAHSSLHLSWLPVPAWTGRVDAGSMPTPVATCTMSFLENYFKISQLQDGASTDELVDTSVQTSQRMSSYHPIYAHFLSSLSEIWCPATEFTGCGTFIFSLSIHMAVHIAQNSAIQQKKRSSTRVFICFHDSAAGRTSLLESPPPLEGSPSSVSRWSCWSYTSDLPSGFSKYYTWLVATAH